FLLVYSRVDLGTVPHEKGFHRRVSGPFVPVDKPVVHSERIPEYRRLLREGRAQVLPAERSLGLGDRRVDQVEIPNPRRSTRLLNHPVVQLNRLGGGQVNHWASRRYNSAFFWRTYFAAASKPSLRARKSSVICRSKSSTGIPLSRAAAESWSAFSSGK